jgi:hypothetical protein
MGVGVTEGFATAQDRGACGAIPGSQQPNSQATNSQGKTNSPSREASALAKPSRREAVGQWAKGL